MSSLRGALLFDPSRQLCPCGEGSEPALRCCLQRGKWEPPEWVAPLGKRTDVSLRKCLAYGLQDCSEKISEEHYISENILEFMGPDGVISISGAAWQNSDESKSLPHKRMVANVLCERHNQMLSPLDTAAGNFFRILSSSRKRISLRLPNSAFKK